MFTYEIQVKEIGKDHVLTPSYSSPCPVSREFLIDWFGLREPDVEWFKIEIVKK